MARLNSDGSAVYGVSAGTIAIDGSVPSALASYYGGLWGWYDATIAMGPAQHGISGAVQIYQYDTVGMSVSVVDPGSANRFAAGGARWAAWVPGDGVRSNLGGSLTLPKAFLGDVSPDGEMVVADSYAASQGLSVYAADGSVLLAKPSVAFGSGTMRLRDEMLAYRTTSGWQLVDVTTGLIPAWYPQATVPSVIVPRVVNGVLWLLELTDVLSVRQADSGNAYVLDSSPGLFWPDAIALTAGIIRVAYSTTIAEGVIDLKEVDFTTATGAITVGVVSGGTIVRTPAGTVTPTAVNLGPKGGKNLTDSVYPPFNDPVTNPQTGDRMTDQWAGWARTVRQNLGTVSLAIQTAPKPSETPAGFSTIAAENTAALVAPAPGSQLTLVSGDGSVTFIASPSLGQLDIRATGNGSNQTVGPPGEDGEDGPPGIPIIGEPGPEGPAPAGTGYVHVTGGILDSPAAEFVVAGALVASPTGIANTGGLMLGLANASASNIITPAVTGRVLITISGEVTQTTASDGAFWHIRTGTGTAPANGAALTGTQSGGQQSMTFATGVLSVPFSLTTYVTGLALGTPVWIDLVLGTVTGGTAAMAEVMVVAVEL